VLPPSRSAAPSRVQSKALAPIMNTYILKYKAALSYLVVQARNRVGEGEAGAVLFEEKAAGREEKVDDDFPREQRPQGAAEGRDPGQF
jgi:hypothetical protein